MLWFANTPSLSADYLNNKSIGGGWIDSLEAELSKISNIQLGVAFNLDRDIKPFIVNETEYFPVHIKSPRGKIKQLASRWKKPILDELDIQPYLNIIHEFNPDVIHIFGTEGVFGLIISKTNVPCVIHLQGILTICHQKWYSGLSAIDVLRYSRISMLIKGFGLYHKYFINKKSLYREKKIFQQCEYFMGRTDWDRRVASVLSPNSKYFYCDEMMRPEFYLRRWEPQNQQAKYVIITTVRNNIYKGLETIFECKNILNQMNLPFEIIWEIAGISKNDEIAYLIEKKYKSSFQKNGIDLLGPLQEQELIGKMLKADVFIHPSHIDNGANSVCEAMMLGMPVIATFAGGIPSSVDNKKEGLLVQDGDPYALAGAILELRKDDSYANMLGANARIKALKRHDKKTIMNDLLKIYETIAHN